jgi:hypothetical protein
MMDRTSDRAGKCLLESPHGLHRNG